MENSVIHLAIVIQAAVQNVLNLEKKDLPAIGAHGLRLIIGQRGAQCLVLRKYAHHLMKLHRHRRLLRQDMMMILQKSTRVAL